MTDPKKWEVPDWYIDPPVRRRADPLVDQQDPPPRQEPARTWRELVRRWIGKRRS